MPRFGSIPICLETSMCACCCSSIRTALSATSSSSDRSSAAILCTKLCQESDICAGGIYTVRPNLPAAACLGLPSAVACQPIAACLARTVQHTDSSLDCAAAAALPTYQSTRVAHSCGALRAPPFYTRHESAAYATDEWQQLRYDTWPPILPYLLDASHLATLACNPHQ